MPKIILLNGPPHCGKDTAVSNLVPYLQFEHLKFSDPLKDRLCAILGISRRELEEIKDKQHKLLPRVDKLVACYTPREALIKDSEEHLKPLYGKDIFGRIFSNRAKQSSTGLVIASDCGFEEEVGRVIFEHGSMNCAIIRIHRNGCSYDGDSRNYLHNHPARTFDITNDGTKHDLTMRVLRVIIREYQPVLLREPDWIK